MNKRLIIVIGVLVVFLACVFLFVIFDGGLRAFSFPLHVDSYYLTLDELMEQSDLRIGTDVRISGVVLGDTIQYDTQKGLLTFTVANIPGDLEEIEEQGGYSVIVRRAIEDSATTRLRISYLGEQPDLLRHGIQAIMIGRLGEDGIFYANEILLKCPTRYLELAPSQVGG